MNTARMRVAVGAAALALLGASITSQEQTRTLLRVGVYDSRAIAIAFAASPQNTTFLKEVRERHDRARDAGDDQQIERIEAEMEGRQARMHKQGFSTAPVDDILRHIEAELPKIAEKAGVDVIVNRWRLAYSHPDAELVDVTELLVERFEPGSKTREYLKQLKDHEPLPLYDTDWDAIGSH